MKIRQSVPFALSILAACVSSSALAAPTSGAYVTDKQNTWVQDRVGDRIGTVNMIMCIIGSMRGDAMVNKGPYVTLIDQGKCEGRGDSSKSTSTSAGASNATNYMSAVVDSSQASTSDPLIIKAWLHDEQENGGSPQKVTIYAYVVATAGKSDANPNGLFKMYFCGAPDASPTTCMFKGSLQSDANGLNFYQEENHGGGPSMTQLILQNNPSTDSGQGRISGTENSTPYAYKFAYDSSNFRRQEGVSADVCFARDKTAGDTSTWRYGTYNADGSRLDVAHPGFPVKYVNGSDSYFGFWSFWGLWLPETAMTAIANHQGTLTRHVGDTDETITPIQKGGKLWALTRHAGQLGDFKNVPMMFWSNTAIGSGPSNGNYELQWDGSQLTAVSYQDCSSNGCSPHALTSPVVLSAGTLRTAHVNALPIFFPSGGGNGAIEVPASPNDFGAASVVSYRTRDVVNPASADIGLNCVTMCPQTGTNLVSGTTLATNPFKGTPAWGPSTALFNYTFHAGMLNDGTADADASGASKSGMGGNQWGLNSGSMVANADLSGIKCDSNGTPNTSGTYYCPYLIDQATTIYQWETGPNQWNQFFGANGITIDPPKGLSLTAAATFTNHVADASNNIRGGSESQLVKYNGNKVQLQFSGFGELQGIPGNCVDPDSNQAVQCGQNTRWVPAFDMIDGASVSDGSQNYYIKFLERELRLGQVSCGTVASSLTLTGASSLTLPTSALVDVNPRITLGAEPAPGSTKPAVIDGIVQ
ncbi:MAG: hypothetical protein KGL57_03605 [Burkholderiales bacterium]|nr:hypothetical protein [Burkholderiales bacterium]